MIIDQIDNFMLYFSNPRLKKVHDFLKSLGADHDEGEFEIAGSDIFARIMSYETIAPEDAALEAHRKYIDIQTCLRGQEGFEWYHKNELDPQKAYDPVDDVEFFLRPTQCRARLEGGPGIFVAFFPDDAHMPKLIVGGRPETVKKVVVKIHTDVLAPGR